LAALEVDRAAPSHAVQPSPERALLGIEGAPVQPFKGVDHQVLVEIFPCAGIRLEVAYAVVEQRTVPLEKDLYGFLFAVTQSLYD
jgi:hypothetical protein